MESLKLSDLGTGEQVDIIDVAPVVQEEATASDIDSMVRVWDESPADFKYGILTAVIDGCFQIFDMFGKTEQYAHAVVVKED